MLLNQAETGRAFPDAAEDEKPMRLFGKQLVLAFGDFSMLHRWRGRARAKGKGKLRQNARRFKVVVAKECMSTMRTRKGAPRERGLVMIRLPSPANGRCLLVSRRSAGASAPWRGFSYSHRPQCMWAGLQPLSCSGTLETETYPFRDIGAVHQGNLTVF